MLKAKKFIKTEVEVGIRENEAFKFKYKFDSRTIFRGIINKDGELIVMWLLEDNKHKIESGWNSEFSVEDAQRKFDDGEWILID